MHFYTVSLVFFGVFLQSSAIIVGGHQGGAFNNFGLGGLHGGPFSVHPLGLTHGNSILGGGGGFLGFGGFGGAHRRGGFFLGRSAEPKESSEPHLGFIDVPGFEKDLWLIFPLNKDQDQRAANHVKRGQRQYTPIPYSEGQSFENKNLLPQISQNQNRLLSLFKPQSPPMGSADFSLYSNHDYDNRKDLLGYGVHKYDVHDLDYGFGHKPSGFHSGYNNIGECCPCPAPPPAASLSLQPYHNAHISRGYALNGYGLSGLDTNGLGHQYGIRGKLGLL